MTAKPKQETPASFKQKKITALTSHFLSLCVPSSCFVLLHKGKVEGGHPTKSNLSNMQNEVAAHCKNDILPTGRNLPLECSKSTGCFLFLSAK